MSSQTADEHPTPMGGIGLVLMMGRLAASRVPAGLSAKFEFGGMTTFPGQFKPLPRWDCEDHERKGRHLNSPLTSAEYWRIFDRISRGERP